MNKTLEGMARAACDADGCDGDYNKNPPEVREALATDMKHALLWLADNVTADMIAACRDERGSWANRHLTPTFLEGKSISAALRAAGESKQ